MLQPACVMLDFDLQVCEGIIKVAKKYTGLYYAVFASGKSSIEIKSS
jgi:hypothetical protein